MREPKTIHAKGLRNCARRAFRENPAFKEGAVEALLREDDTLLWRVFSQYPRQRGPGIYDGFAVVLLKLWLSEGYIVHKKIPLRSGAQPDHDVTGNQSILDDAIEFGIEATFQPALEGDGNVKWTRDLPFVRHQTGYGGEIDHVLLTTVDVPPATLILEVGTTDASRTLSWMRSSFGVARLPYGDPTLHLLHWHPDWRYSPLEGWYRWRPEQAREYRPMVFHGPSGKPIDS